MGGGARVRLGLGFSAAAAVRTAGGMTLKWEDQPQGDVEATSTASIKV